MAVKSEAQQARGILFCTRDLLDRQRTQKVNVLHGHLAEFDVIAPRVPPTSYGWRRPLRFRTRCCPSLFVNRAGFCSGRSPI